MPSKSELTAKRAVVLAALLAPRAQAFGPTSFTPSPFASKTALREASATGGDRRSSWETFAPYANDGKVGIYGEIGCPGGGDWCHGDGDHPSGGGTVAGSPGRDRRSSWGTFAPTHGGTDVYGEIGCPGGGDWCHDDASADPPSTPAATNVASTLAGLGTASPPIAKQYGIGAWKLAGSSATGSTVGSANVVVAPVATSSSSAPTKLRRPIVAGNWKLNPATRGEALTLLKLLAANFVNHRDGVSKTSDPEVVVFPPLPYLADAVRILEGSGIQVGAQNAGPNEKGAFTGDVAASMLVSSGCSYVLLGHSERRTLFGETDEHINAVLRKSLEQPSLKVIFCIGETLQEYENGLLEQVVDAQIRKGLDGVEADVLLSDKVIIAYEPVWAIGTGLVATPDQAQAAHVAIRNSLADIYGSGEVAESVRIQYGGSVTPESVEQLMGEMDVDGALVGGASLNPDSFTRIYDGAASADFKKKATSFVSAVKENGQFVAQYPPRELVATEVLPTKNALGESPVWSDKDQALYWVSATEGEVWRWNLKDPPHRRLMNTAVGCIGLLESSDPGSLVVAGESAMLTTTLVGDPIKDFASGPEYLVDRPDHMTATRPNDGRIDRFGNFVLGMYNQYHRAGATEGDNNAGLFRLNAQTLQWQEILQEYRFRVSNCICFSGGGSTMYFGDTPTRRVYAFDYSADGPLTNRRLVWTMPADMPGAPDGAQVDSQGKLWIAITGGGVVVQLDPTTGLVEMIVHVDANPTSLTFGGANLDELFITTRAPNGGGLWRVKMPYGVRGLPEPEFKSNPKGSQYSAGLSYLATL